MIIVTGSVVAHSDTLDQLVTLSLEHVHRSRAEPGCLLHTVHQDVEHPLRLVFFEQWLDQAALDVHFAVPASRKFAKMVGELAAEPPAIQIYAATPIKR